MANPFPLTAPVQSWGSLGASILISWCPARVSPLGASARKGELAPSSGSQRPSGYAFGGSTLQRRKEQSFSVIRLQTLTRNSSSTSREWGEQPRILAGHFVPHGDKDGARDWPSFFRWWTEGKEVGNMTTLIFLPGLGLFCLLIRTLTLL